MRSGSPRQLALELASSRLGAAKRLDRHRLASNALASAAHAAAAPASATIVAGELLAAWIVCVPWSNEGGRSEASTLTSSCRCLASPTVAVCVELLDVDTSESTGVEADEAAQH